MRWYSGGIADAISFAKSNGAIFVVYIEGKDDKSQQISALIETDVVGSKLGSDNFVAIKIEADSVPHQQFSEFYKQTPVPSIYFIGKSGSPIKIVTDAEDAGSFCRELDEILEGSGISSPQTSSSSNAASASQNFISGEQSVTKPPNVVCENGVCTIKKDPEPKEPASNPAEGDQKPLSAEEKVERAKKLLDAKRLEKEREEKEKEKQEEIERRKMGQEVQKMKKWQEDQELKQLKEEREREKRLEKEARDRVLAQIAQDKADRAAKFQPAAASTPTNKEPIQPTPGPSTSKSDSNTARLQFKMPDGSSKTQEFPSTDKLISVINYIKANFNLSTNKFTLSTTFPRRQFSENDHNQTLAELELTPNAVILVLPLNHGTVSTSQGARGLTGFIWSLLTPLISILNFIKTFLGLGDAGHVSGDQPSTSKGYPEGGSRTNSVTHVRSKYDLENRLKSSGSRLVVIDFFATWCGPCRMIAPELERMARDFPNVVFLKVDVDENGDISREYGISAMPTFVFLKNRREVARVQGADSYSLSLGMKESHKDKSLPKASGTTTIRKEGNIRRLADIRKDDDENNTWNGNSTQQM